MRHLRLAVSLIATGMFVAGSACAATIDWKYTSSTVNGSGQFTEIGGAITSFSGTIISPLGVDSALSLIANPNGTARYTTPDGRFYVNNAYPVDTDGFYVSGNLVPGGEYNLWSDLIGGQVNPSTGPGELWAAKGGSYVVTSAGTLTLSSTPEPAAWALMLIGVGGIGGALRGARRRAVAAA